MNHLFPLFAAIVFGCWLPTSVLAQKTTEAAEPEAFEGWLTYESLMLDRTGQMDSLTSLMVFGDRTIYSIDRKRYKTVGNGRAQMQSWYPGGDTLYTTMLGIPGAIASPIGESDDQLIDFSIDRDAQQIGAYLCDRLTIRSAKGTTHYYFDAEILPADSTAFRKHELGFWNLCIQQTGALPIMLISDLEDAYSELRLERIETAELDDAEFTVPDMPRVVLPK